MMYRLEIETNDLFIEKNWKYKKPNNPQLSHI